MNETKKADGKAHRKIKEQQTITNPDAVSIVFHEKKGEILSHLVKKEMTIIDLKHATDMNPGTVKMNPGTVKRHLTDLLDHDLVFISREQVNEFSIVMKYYRASAKTFEFNITWPE
ncbi:MAG: winged helix-turn-helix domain-containing protein [Candidatus Heimdallarchaeota archaeon]